MLQEGEQLQQEVCWPADRMHAEATSLKQEVDRLQASMRTDSNARTVADVESDLEILETNKRNADNRKDALLNKQTRLR